MTKESYEKIKPAVVDAFESAALAAMLAMGEDLKGVDWFSATANEYQSEAKRVA